MMTDETKDILDGQQIPTINLLALQGQDLLAEKLRGCVPHSRCRQLYCAQCSYIRGLDLSNRCTEAVLASADRYEAIYGKPLAMYAFTVKVDDVPVQALRTAAEKMVLDLYEVISEYSSKGIILGSTATFEAPPAQQHGIVTQEFHPHFHGLFAVETVDARVLPIFSALPAEWDGDGDNENRMLLNKEAIVRYVTYCHKAIPDQFAGRWQVRREQPATFLARANALQNFQLCRSTGYFRPAAKTSPRTATRRLQRLDKVTRREKLKHK
jgi:hypothetical protein